jgi:preprotein translocase subunit YajC
VCRSFAQSNHSAAPLPYLAGALLDEGIPMAVSFVASPLLTALPLLQAPAGGGGGEAMLMQLLPLVMILVVFYFLLIRPQQKRLKEHRAMVEALRRGDTVVTSGGFIGKVTKVADDELTVELAPNVNVRLQRHAVTEVRGKGEPVAANDAKTTETKK